MIFNSLFINVFPKIAFFLAVVLTINWFPDTRIAQSDETLSEDTKIIPVAEGWGGNSINTAIFQTNSVITFQNTQYTVFYDSTGNLMAAKGERGKKEWEINKTGLEADVEDTHNSISITVDGNGLLYLSWAMHGQEILYAQWEKPGSLEVNRLHSMSEKSEGNPVIASYWKGQNDDAPGFMWYGITERSGRKKKWETAHPTFRSVEEEPTLDPQAWEKHRELYLLV